MRLARVMASSAREIGAIRQAQSPSAAAENRRGATDRYRIGLGFAFENEPMNDHARHDTADSAGDRAVEDATQMGFEAAVGVVVVMLVGRHVMDAVTRMDLVFVGHGPPLSRNRKGFVTLWGILLRERAVSSNGEAMLRFHVESNSRASRNGFRARADLQF